ncbi:MAG TPA: bifunctional glutamate N-acetyltransferase/amino-acid acetyltransferase ArgJ [Gemmataceae bacterium]|nr:bifunctional glutamate N-acetyltransferase/amino-acid acetyltransferase ArgJ [Gemmataceae bacterium]
MTPLYLAQGFRFAGLHCGIRPDPDRRDLALIVSDRPAAAAGVFTQNRVRAAPVRVCLERLPSDNIRGVVICSGNANACTGPRGLEDARTMTAVAGRAIGCQAEQMLVCSTGIIGRHLPMPKIESGILAAATLLADTPTAFDDVARAILTTDTRIKTATRQIDLNGTTVRLTGVAKGAAMIGPNMATMLAFVFTDAAVSAADLAVIARRAAEQTFNCISVEGHTSTNDTLLLMANGISSSEFRVLSPENQDSVLRTQNSELRTQRFAAAVTDVCGELARAIAADAEGATHLVTIDVEGLRDDREAYRVAKTIAESALVKTALYGADPNWGRIVSAAGYAGVEFEEEHLSLWLGDLLLYHTGVPQPFDADTASAYLKRERHVQMRLRFSLGPGRCTFWTCDLTQEYIRLNADYTT